MAIPPEKDPLDFLFDDFDEGIGHHMDEEFADEILMQNEVNVPQTHSEASQAGLALPLGDSMREADSLIFDYMPNSEFQSSVRSPGMKSSRSMMNFSELQTLRQNEFHPMNMSSEPLSSQPQEEFDRLGSSTPSPLFSFQPFERDSPVDSFKPAVSSNQSQPLRQVQSMNSFETFMNPELSELSQSAKNKPQKAVTAKRSRSKARKSTKKGDKKVEFAVRSKREGSSHTDKSEISSKMGDEGLEERRQRRLARNRESARQSRRRKKEQLEQIEQRVVQMSLELDKERRDFFLAYLRNRRKKKMEFLKQIQSISDETVIMRKLQDFDSLFGFADSKEHEVRKYHFDHAFGLLFPPYLRFFLQMVSYCTDDMGNSGNNNRRRSQSQSQQMDMRDSSGIWERFCKDLGLSTAQKEKLKTDLKGLFSIDANTERKKLQLVANYLQNFQRCFELRLRSVGHQTRAICDVLTPSQIAQFLLFFEQSVDPIELEMEQKKGSETNNHDSSSGEMANESDLFGTENLKRIIDMHNIDLDSNTRSAMDLLQKDDKDLSFEDIQLMLSVVSQ